MLAKDGRYGAAPDLGWQRPAIEGHAPLMGKAQALRQWGAANNGAVIEDETSWRQPKGLGGLAIGSVTALASRWRGASPGLREESVTTPSAHHTVAIALRHMKLSFAVEGRLVHEGRVTPGMVQVSRPGERAAALFDGAFDSLHLFVPAALVAECREAIGGADEMELRDLGFVRDAVIERLAQALLRVEDAGEFGRPYAETLSLAIVSRLLGRQGRGEPAGAAPLPKWRLRRVTQHVDENLSEPLSLADLAQVAGLSRMHFAAQFRAATGFRPHEYILRRRIEQAQERMASTRMALVEVALSVGFRTQAHFGTVFKRFAGTTPQEWRRQSGSFGRS